MRVASSDQQSSRTGKDGVRVVVEDNGGGGSGANSVMVRGGGDGVAVEVGLSEVEPGGGAASSSSDMRVESAVERWEEVEVEVLEEEVTDKELGFGEWEGGGEAEAGRPGMEMERDADRRNRCGNDEKVYVGRATGIGSYVGLDQFVFVWAVGSCF